MLNINDLVSPPEDIYLEEDIMSMPLDFNTIKEQTESAKKGKPPTKNNKNPIVYELTEKEVKQLDVYLKDMEKHINKYALDGKDKFFYDCSKLNATVFISLAQKFKDVNPKFYVETHFGTQMIVVDWCGKYEV